MARYQQPAKISPKFKSDFDVASYCLKVPILLPTRPCCWIIVELGSAFVLLLFLLLLLVLCVVGLVNRNTMTKAIIVKRQNDMRGRWRQ